MKISISKLDSLLSVNKVLETDKSIVIDHPNPKHKKHLLVIPKKKLNGLENLDDEKIDYLYDVFKTAEEIIKKFKLNRDYCEVDLNKGNDSYGWLRLHVFADN